VANNLAAYRLWGSDTAAIGGAISYQYAKTGSLGTLTHDQMRAVLNAPGFGTSAQPIAPGTSAMAAVSEATSIQLLGAPAPIAPETGASEQLSPALAFDRPVSEPSSREPDLRVTLERMSANSGAKPYPLGARDLDAAAHASGWCRIARELPSYLDNGFASSAEHRSPRFFAGISGSSLPFVAAVGLIDTGRHDLRPFEGLKEGFASIGDR